MLKIFLFFIILFQILIYPITNFLIPSLRKRRLFELGNPHQRGHESFNDQVAKVCFEVSSEGELEQIKPLLVEMLERGELVELVYCSDSVTHQCLKLYDLYPKNIRLFRMPLLTYLPWKKNQSLKKWKTAQTVALCRYDFFPELVWRGKGERKILFWGSLKSFSKKSFLEKFFLKLVYQDFDLVFAATNTDRILFEKLIGANKVLEQDFRPVQIIHRINSREEKIRNTFTHYNEASSFFNSLEKSQVDVMGSFWPVDQPILDAYKAEDKKIVFIAPHQLDLVNSIKGIVLNRNSLAEFNEILEKKSRETVFVVMDVKGFLCELYTFSSRAYVSGGFGRSVHSLLEPALSGNKIVCGPKVYRSTEYDLVQENLPSYIAIAKTPEDVLQAFDSFNEIELENLLTWKEKIAIMNQKSSDKFYRFLERTDAKTSL